MNKTQHTQGQWKYEIWHYDLAIPQRKEICIVNDRNRIAIIESNFPELNPRGNENPYTIPTDEAIANANLIAAAPELLEALEKLLADHKAMTKEAESLNRYKMSTKAKNILHAYCESAINKAKGDL